MLRPDSAFGRCSVIEHDAKRLGRGSHGVWAGASRHPYLSPDAGVGQLQHSRFSDADSSRPADIAAGRQPSQRLEPTWVLDLG